MKPERIKAPKPHRDLHDWLMLVFVFLAFLAAGFAACYTREEVGVAQDTLDEFRTSSKAELRAYVLAYPFRHVNGVEPNKIVQTRVRFQNSGQTPASSVEFKARVAVRGEPPDPKQIILFSDTPRRRTDTDVAPSADIRQGDTFNAEKRLTPEQFEAVKTGEDARFYVWGAINYDDVFGLPHHSYFCFYYQGFVRSPDKGMGSPFTDYCPHPKND